MVGDVFTAVDGDYTVLPAVAASDGLVGYRLLLALRKGLGYWVVNNEQDCTNQA